MNELILGDYLAGVLNQGYENFKGSTSEWNRIFALKEELLSREKAKWGKGEGKLDGRAYIIASGSFGYRRTITVASGSGCHFFGSPR